MDSLDQGPENIACGENKYSNDTRLDREERCNNCNRKLYLGFEKFCCCVFEDYTEDPSLHCVEIKDCLTDEEQILETSASSDDNDSLKWLLDALKLSPNYSVSHNCVEIESKDDRFEQTIFQDILDMEFEKLENPSANNKPLEIESQIDRFEETFVQDILDMEFEELEDPLAGNNKEEYESPVPNPSEPLDYTLMMFIREWLEEPSAEV